VVGFLNSFTLIGRLANLGLGLALDGVFLKNSREDESEADALGAHIMAEAGYDPVALARFFEKLERQGGPGVPEFLSDHPSPGNRVEAVEAEARTLPRRTYNSDKAEFEQAKGVIAKLPPPPDFRPADIGVTPANAAGYKKLSTAQLSIEYPAAWRARGDTDSHLLALVPADGIVVGAHGEPAIGYGAVLSYFFADPDRSALKTATGDVIQKLRTIDSGLHDEGQKSVEVDGQPALLTQYSGDSPFGGVETDLLLTVARPEGLFCLIFIAPERNRNEGEDVFDRMTRSIRFVKP
jgi:hypothetical protein